MTAEPVTVAITNYDGAEHLGPCLEAVRALDWPSVEIVVVDNASTDRSLEILREEHPDVRVIELEENRGPGPARNVAIRSATTDLVLSIDNDAVLEPGSLRELVVAMRSRSDVVACQPRTVYDDDPGRIHYDGGTVHYLGTISLRNFRRPVADCPAETREDDVLIAVAILWDRTKLREDEGFDEDFFIFFEDQDVAHRLRLAGHSILTVSGAVVRHRHGTAGVSYRPGGKLTDRRAYFFTRNRLWLVRKNYATRTLLLVAPALLAYELIWAAYLTTKGRLGSYLRGLRDAARGRRRIAQKRRIVQSRRVLSDREILVGGPLTFAVPDTEKKLQKLVVAAMDAAFRAYWACVRGLVR